jgi:hypothetical protein
MAADNASPQPKAQAKPRAATIPPSQVQFDTSNLKSSYCNVCNGSSTREEVVINFGVNESWDMGREKLLVHLQHRIVMSPYAAKRLRDMMNRLIEEHETVYGKLEG